MANYWDFEPGVTTLSCSSCEWSGTTGYEESFRDLVEVSCPRCDRNLLLLMWPSPEETRAAARDGNRRAQAEVPGLERAERRQANAAATELTGPDQLPDLDGGEIVIDWDLVEADGETWTVLRHNSTEIWRELAYWEGYERFGSVFEILVMRYGTRLVEVRPTEGQSWTYLYGDNLNLGIVEALNAGLPDAD